MTFDPESYARWRATIPFTDEAFALVHEGFAATWERDGHAYKRDQYLRAAARCRRGRICGWDLTTCMSTLVKSCAICGKVALYRFASSGRCSKHRLVLNPHVVARQERLERLGSAIEAQRIRSDAALLNKRKRPKRAILQRKKVVR